MTVDDDPFATPDHARVGASKEDIVRGGRYRLPRRDGTHKPRGWMRTTNLVGAISDAYALRLWEIGEALTGVSLSATLYAQLLADAPAEMDKATRRAWAATFLEQAKDISGGNRAAQHGNYRHQVVEDWHEGLPTAHHEAGARRHLHLYADALVRNQLRAVPHMQERIVLNEAVEACGRLDNVVEDLRTGLLHIGDLKTKKDFWSWLELKAQLAVYANADAMWDETTGTWVDMPPVDRSVGMLLWMPRIDPTDVDQEPRVEVYEAPLEDGWTTAQLAYQVVQARRLHKNASTHGVRVRVAPIVSETERWAARFAAVDSMDDGSRLVDECRAAGAWNMVVAGAARAAVERLTGTKNLVS